ncbi:MAG: preprotein translocase subunit SecG [Bacillota bacterium]
MLTVARIVHWIISIGLIAVVMMQPERSAGFGSVFGGSSEGPIGRRRKGTEALLARLTVYLAVGFVVSAIALTLLRRGAAG